MYTVLIVNNNHCKSQNIYACLEILYIKLILGEIQVFLFKKEATGDG